MCKQSSFTLVSMIYNAPRIVFFSMEWKVICAVYMLKPEGRQALLLKHQTAKQHEKKAAAV